VSRIFLTKHLLCATVYLDSGICPKKSTRQQKRSNMTPSWFLVVFVVLGWAYYMVAVILMRGSIFEPMRQSINFRAEHNRFFGFVQEMLGCLMCTATEASLWTLGLTTFVLGVWLHFPETGIDAVTGQQVHLPALAEIALMGMVSFAISLAVAGEAWAIKTIVEHREMKFLAMRSELREREIDLMKRLQECETGSQGDFIFDLSEN